MIKFPYGRRDFFELITEDYLYLDRTHYIRFVEEWGKELLFMRPRRFGKSLWLSTLMNYYDVAKDRRAVLQRADNIILMEDGRVIDNGTLEALLERSSEMQRLWQGEYKIVAP